MPRAFLSLFAVVSFIAFFNQRLSAQSTHRIWAIHDGEKVERDDRNHPLKAGNSVWNGRRIKLFGARNETVAFQVIVEAGDGGIRKLTATLRELKLKGGAPKIAYAPPAGDPSDYVGRPIQLFSVNYMNVTRPTGASWIYRPGTPAAPKDPTGWKPVQLIPENAKAGKGGFPLKVEPNQTQAIWIELYTARDLPAGIYQGEVMVAADGKATRIPVELELLDFTLPDENSMYAMVYYQPSQPELYQGRNLDAVYHRFAHRHRVELVYAYSIESAKAAMGRFRGSDFTRAAGYEGPGESAGNRIVPASFYGPGADYDDRDSAWKKSDAWMTFLKENLPGAITFLYMPDELSPAQFARIRAIADNIHSNPGPGRALPIFVTHRYVKELDGAIDVWDSGPRGYDIELAKSERAKGRDYWIYNGGRPWGGAIVIDAPATDARATIWACFKHQIKVYFYWHGVHWRHNMQKQGERVQNVWANPVTFDNRGQPGRPYNDQNFANGDGVLLYPGEEKLHPEEDRGVAGPISTVQLANFRRGLQDHQYLTMARKLGLHALVEETLQSVVPRVFSDAQLTVGFAEEGDAYEAARYKLAKAISAAAKKQ
ncbi:MAG: glycoside hydrolase domain-containing protein [Blastocatellia bacterium]